MTLRIMVAEDSFLVREGIMLAISLIDDVEVVATCENYDELIAAVDTMAPDVVITDIRMPPTR